MSLFKNFNPCNYILLLAFILAKSCQDMRWSFYFLLIKIDLIDSDGAAALVLVSGEKALKLGLQVIAKMTGYADAARVLFTYLYKC